MRHLRARLDTMKKSQRRAPEVGDFNETKDEYVEIEEVVGKQAIEERLPRIVVKLVLTGEIDRPSTERVEPVRGCLITQAVWNEPP
jgi:hypothetical protein